MGSYNKSKTVIPFCVADRPASLRILKGVDPKIYEGHIGIMAHANTSENFQKLFGMYPCVKDGFCDVVNKKCPYGGKISKCSKGKMLRARTIKICDSGIFTKHGCMIEDYENLFEIYECMGVDYGVIIDYLKDKDRTVKSAMKAIKIYKNKKYCFKLIGVSQGKTLKEYLECYEQLKEMGYTYIGVGGLLKKNKNSARYVRVRNEKFLDKVLGCIRKKYPDDWLFALGCYHPKRHRMFEKHQIFGSDYKGWIFQYEKDETMNEKAAQKDRFKQVRSYLRTEVYDKLCVKQRLLVISCSERKKKVIGHVPAFELYDGVNYRSIKKLKREEILPSNVDIKIVSAKYGLIDWDKPIKHYEKRITSDHAKVLQSQVTPKLETVLSNNGYTEIFINMGNDYMLAIDGFKKFIPNDVNLFQAEGRIGQRMARMKGWLLKKG